MNIKKADLDWETIPGYGGIYQISRWGSVRRVSFYDIIPVSVGKASNGKSVVYLRKNNRQHCHMLHKIYAETFGVSEKMACRILYEGYKGDEQSRENVRKWLREKIESLPLEDHDEILYLKKFLLEMEGD